MNDKIKNALEWVKDHKVEIACGAVTIVCGAVFVKACKESRAMLKALEATKPMPNPEKFIPDIDIGVVTDYGKYAEGTVTELWMDHIPLDKMGALATEIREKVPGIPENAIVWTILNIRPDEVIEG